MSDAVDLEYLNRKAAASFLPYLCEDPHRTRKQRDNDEPRRFRLYCECYEWTFNRLKAKAGDERNVHAIATAIMRHQRGEIDLTLPSGDQWAACEAEFAIKPRFPAEPLP